MTPQAWLDDFCARLELNEGFKTTKYQDSLGIWTIGVGFNLERPDARAMLAQVGASYDAVMAFMPLTGVQVVRLLELSVAPIIDEARSSLQPMHYDLLSDARRCAVADLDFNLGLQGWMAFYGVRGLLDEAVHNAVRLHDPTRAHILFGQAADHLLTTAYASQVGARATRNAQMLRSSVYP